MVSRRLLKQLEEARQFYIDNPEMMSQDQWILLRDEIKNKQEK